MTLNVNGSWTHLSGPNVLWGDGHVRFIPTPVSFGGTGTGGDPSDQTPGDNPTKWRRIVPFLRP